MGAPRGADAPRLTSAVSTSSAAPSRTFCTRASHRPSREISNAPALSSTTSRCPLAMVSRSVRATRAPRAYDALTITSVSRSSSSPRQYIIRAVLAMWRSIDSGAAGSR